MICPKCGVTHPAVHQAEPFVQPSRLMLAVAVIAEVLAALLILGVVGLALWGWLL